MSLQLDAPFPAPSREGMNLLDWVSLDPAIRFGRPCVRGTRITVGDVLGCLAWGLTEGQVLADSRTSRTRTSSRVSRSRPSVSVASCKIPAA